MYGWACGVCEGEWGGGVREGEEGWEREGGETVEPFPLTAIPSACLPACLPN